MESLFSGVLPVDYKDYYQTLGVPRSASADEIKKAYRKLVRQHHPDLSRDKNANQKTKEINEAYEVLGDADKRAAYDALGSSMHAGQPFEPPPEWGANMAGGFGSAEDVFADLFAHIGRRGRANFARRGQDIHATLQIDLADAWRGASRVVTLREGEREQTLPVTIPKGVVAGQQLRLAGRGQAGLAGGPPGDLLLEIDFKPDRHYRVAGRDLLRGLAVAPWEAALGAQVEVPTPGGPLQVTVPPGSQTGRKLRLKGRGIPGEPPGDLYLVLEVVLPPATSERAKALYRAMERELGFDPRAGVRA